jgi:hypothetical protein
MSKDDLVKHSKNDCQKLSPVNEIEQITKKDKISISRGHIHMILDSTKLKRSNTPVNENIIKPKRNLSRLNNSSKFSNLKNHSRA